MARRPAREHDGKVRRTRPLPETGSIILDSRRGGRALRVSWHPETDQVVLSLWRENVCVGSFRLDADEVPDLIESLRAGLTDTTQRASSA